MSKRGRKANLAEDAQKKSGRAMKELGDLANLVAGLFGAQSQCIPAAAIVTTAATKLGYKARPRAVSALLWHAPTSTFVVTSADALAMAENLALPLPAGPLEAPDFGWAGHMVVTVDEPLTLWDANFAQFSREGGIPDLVLAIRIADTVPQRGFWDSNAAAHGLYVRYLPGPYPAGFAKTWSRTTTLAHPIAERLAQSIRAGTSDNLELADLRAMVGGPSRD